MDEVAPTFQSLLQNNKNIEFVQRNIDGIDINNNEIYLSNTNTKQKNEKLKPEIINYKSLVVATGASIDLSSIKGANEYALPFYTLQNCYDLRKQLSVLDLYIKEQIKLQKEEEQEKEESNKKEISVVIVGGGYGGVELALNIKERLSIACGNNDNKNDMNLSIKITILHRGQEILQYANDYNRNNGQKRLRDAGIETCTGQSVIEVKPLPATESTSALKHRCQIVTTDSTYDADLLLWTAGSMSKNEQRDILNSNLPRDSYGRIITNQFLQVKDVPNVYALGDCARSKKIPYGATAAVAMQQAPVVAWNVFASTRMEQEEDDQEQQKGIDYNGGSSNQFDPLPFEYLDLGQMMTLGSDDATIASPSGLFELDGSIASVARRLIYAVRMPTLQQALTAAISSTSKRFERSSLKKVNKVIDWK